jgi:hypothetical protein
MKKTDYNHNLTAKVYVHRSIIEDPLRGRVMTDVECSAMPSYLEPDTWVRIQCNEGKGATGATKIRITNAAQLSFCGVRVYGSHDRSEVDERDLDFLPIPAVSVGVDSDGYAYYVNKQGAIFKESRVSGWNPDLQ